MPDTPDKKYNDVYKNKTFQKPANFEGNIQGI